MGKKMSKAGTDFTILIIVALVFGAFNGWALMLGAGLLHSSIGTPTIGYFPTAFWLGVIYTFLGRFTTKYPA